MHVVIIFLLSLGMVHDMSAEYENIAIKQIPMQTKKLSEVLFLFSPYGCHMLLNVLPAQARSS